jgi:hypothetical protein
LNKNWKKNHNKVLQHKKRKKQKKWAEIFELVVVNLLSQTCDIILKTKKLQ